MNITRHNYEEFFILYLDNELPAADRLRVEAFAAQHPDLKEELELLQYSKLAPDTTIVFDGKEELLKQTGVAGISMDNYKEWLLLYTDSELTAGQKQAVENFISVNPPLQTELDLLAKTRLQPDTNIIFANKEVLYRSEEKVRVIPFNWKRIAAAAAILFAVGTSVFYLVNKKEEVPSEIAEKGIKETKSTEQVTKQAIPSVTPPDQQLAENSRDKTAEADNSIKDVQAVKATDRKMKEQELHSDVKQNIAFAIDNKNDNNLPQPKNNPYVQEEEINYTTARPETPYRETLTFTKEIKQAPAVTPGIIDPLDNIRTDALTASSSDVAFASEPVRKNKLRGFFRKVTRTFEKTTNIKATDDEDRLLIGGLAIRL